MGDRVELKTTGGGTVLTGFVERIDVMRTIVRTDKGVPVAVPNRSITEMIVSNESRLGRSNVAANFKVRPCFPAALAAHEQMSLPFLRCTLALL